MYDLIGDIHGHADELLQLLKLLGYQSTRGVYRHPERKVIFLGDFIDRGPKIRQSLEIVRPMVEEGSALAVIGNHELNALAYHTEDPNSRDGNLRPHSDKNVKQHQGTVAQLKGAELKSYLDWFRTLPMWLDLEGLRVVHACWDAQAVNKLNAALAAHRRITTEFLAAACKRGNALFEECEIVLKGKEIPLPEGVSFFDPDGHRRTEIRARWYLSPQGQTYREYAFQSHDIGCDMEIEQSVIETSVPYPEHERPVFIGHYWLSADCPEVLAENVACLDYSVAKGGFLCAYRWNGEQKLRNESFITCKTTGKFQ